MGHTDDRAQDECKRGYVQPLRVANTPTAGDKNLRKAISHLKEGIRYPNWEHEPVAEFRCQAVYNLACFYARLAAGNRFAKKAFVLVLRKAARFGLANPEDVARDFHTKSGDFCAFVQYKGTDAEELRCRDMLLKLEKPLSAKYK